MVRQVTDDSSSHVHHMCIKDGHESKIIMDVKFFYFYLLMYYAANPKHLLTFECYLCMKIRSYITWNDLEQCFICN